MNSKKTGPGYLEEGVPEQFSCIPAVKEGELFAFLGENGAGKSTTINIPNFRREFRLFATYFRPAVSQYYSAGHCWAGCWITWTATSEAWIKDCLWRALRKYLPFRQMYLNRRWVWIGRFFIVGVSAVGRKYCCLLCPCFSVYLGKRAYAACGKKRNNVFQGGFL